MGWGLIYRTHISHKLKKKQRRKEQRGDKPHLSFRLDVKGVPA